jgi:hypothetical protein
VVVLQARGEEAWRELAMRQGRRVESMLTATSNRVLLIGDELFETWCVVRDAESVQLQARHHAALDLLPTEVE